MGKDLVVSGAKGTLNNVLVEKDLKIDNKLVIGGVNIFIGELIKSAKKGFKDGIQKGIQAGPGKTQNNP